VALEYEGAWHTTRIAADLHLPGPLLARIAAALGE
jgi:hypothetical protein